MQSIEKLKGRRNAIIAEQRSTIDKAGAEERGLTVEEREAFDRHDADIEQLDADIAREERLLAREAELAEVAEKREAPAVETADADPVGRGSKVYARAWDQYMRHGVNGVTDPEEQRALSVGTNSAGGFLVPEDFERTLVESLADNNVMRSLATVVTTEGDKPIPVVSSEGAAAWTNEAASFNQSDDVFAQVTLNAYKATRLIKTSTELLQDSAFDLQAHLARSFGRSFGTLEEAAFVDGDGSSKPTGVTGGASAGVTAAGAAAITASELIDLIYSLRRVYRPRARFLMADGTLKAVRKLQDSNSNFLWQPSFQAGEPDRIGGYPVATSVSMPAMTTGNISVLFGDFSYYWVGDRAGRSFQRLDELYAATGEVGWVSSYRVDGKLTLAEAVKKLTQA